MRHVQTLLLLGAILLAACSATPNAADDAPTPPTAGTPVNPIAYDASSIARGQSLYRGNCVDCHDRDGRARISDVANARDLTDLSTWKTGGSDGATFLVIRDGLGDDMPAFETFVSDEDIWYIVNYLKSIRGTP